MSHEGTAQVRHFQTRVIIFECRMNDRASSVLLIGSMGPDFAKTSQAVAEIQQFFDFPIWRPPPSWIFQKFII